MYYFQFSHTTYYQKCKLVHGDLSEYNILYFEVVKLLWNKPFSKHTLLFKLTVPYIHSDVPIVQGHLYIIDVSQSVDLDHPSASDFLKEDCLHVSVSETWTHHRIYTHK
jgi:RIO kinase 1